MGIQDSIILRNDNTFFIRGDADLEDCNTILNLNLDQETLKDFGTLSGFLCMVAGEIPVKGDFLMSRGWAFDITHVDDKKILGVTVSPLLGSTSTNNDDNDASRREDDDIMISQESMDDVNSNLDETTDSNALTDDNGNTILPSSTFTPSNIYSDKDEVERIEQIVSMNEVKKSFIKGMRDVVAATPASFNNSIEKEFQKEDQVSRFVDTMDNN